MWLHDAPRTPPSSQQINGLRALLSASLSSMEHPLFLQCGLSMGLMQHSGASSCLPPLPQAQARRRLLRRFFVTISPVFLKEHLPVSFPGISMTDDIERENQLSSKRKPQILSRWYFLRAFKKYHRVVVVVVVAGQ